MELRLSYTFPEPIIEDTGHGISVTMDGLSASGSEGEPLLPFRTARVLLPPGTEFSSFDVETPSSVWIGGADCLKTVGTCAPISDSEASQDLCCTAHSFYSVPYLCFPIRQVEYVGTHVLDGMNVAVLKLLPVKYDVIDGLCYFPRLNITIHLISSESSTPMTCTDSEAVRFKIDNPEVLDSYRIERAFLGSGSPVRYVIITSASLAQDFADLAEWKESRGAEQRLLANMTSEVVTVEWIKANPSYWGDPISHGGKGNDTQTQIRNFIKDVHTNWGVQFALLGGDDEIVPLRTVRVTGLYTEDIPADIYYSGLDGSWDTDNDGIYGEGADQGGGTAGDEADLLSEVSVGRATIDTPAEARNFVDKVISYERDYSSSYLNKSLMVGNKLDDRPTWGGDYKDEVVAESFPVTNPDLDIMRLYERDGTFSEGALLSALNGGVNVVNHMGHGSDSEFADMTISDVEDLVNTKYFVLYSQACDIGAFDQATSGQQESIAEHFLSSEHAAVAMIVNSRYGWYAPGSTNGPSQLYDIEFFDAVFDERIRNLGSALSDSKEDIISSIGSIGSMRWCCMSINLLGDPEMEIHFIEDRGHDVGVSDVEIGPPYVGKSCAVTSIVRNLGSADEYDVPVELLVDGTLASTSYVDITAGGVVEAQFDWVPTDIRPTILTVRTNLTSDSWMSNDETSIEADVSWEISDIEIVEGEVLSLSGSIVVAPTGQLRLFNSTLRFESSWNRNFGIDDSGSVDIVGCSILSDGEVGFHFTGLQGSSTSIQNTSFQRCVGVGTLPGMRIMGGSVQMKNVSLNACDGVTISESNEADISDVTLSNATGGLRIEDSSGIVIVRADVVGARVGLEIENSSNVDVLDCRIRDCYLGLEVEMSESLTVRGNIMNGSRFDFGITGSEIAHFLHDVSSNSLTAGDLVYLVDREDMVVNQSHGDVGCVVLVSCTNISLNDLDLHNNVDGLLIYGSSKITVTRCSFHDNIIGIHAVDCDGNLVYRNDFLSNEISAWDDGINSYNLSYPAGGNFWDDYASIDEHSGPSQNMPGGDGIGDTPHSVQGGSCVDRYPFLTALTDENYPPIADFTYSPANPLSSEPIRFEDASYDPDGRIVNWTWDFGDGRVAFSRNVTHSYSDEGEYGVVLTVRDDESVENSVSETIIVENRPPVVSFSYSPDFPAVGEVVQFSDDSVDTDGLIVSWEWDFGDGSTSSEADPSHAFASKGVYSVTLVVKDDDGAISTLTKRVPAGDEMPQAGFSYTPQEPTTLNEVQFIDSSNDPDGSITEWSWDFGDGSYSSKKNPSHRYSEDGFYEVRLVVSDDVGATDGANVGLTVHNIVPSVTFGWSPSAPSTCSLIQFSDDSEDPDGSVVDFYWDFGDGASSDQESPTHRYADDGWYSVSLTIKDDDGASNTTSRLLQVSNSLALVSFEMSSSPASLEEVSFLDRSVDPDGEIASWNWSFGDGFGSEEMSPEHSYARPGDYVVTLTVEDDDGGLNSTRKTLRVRNLSPLADFDWEPVSESAASTVRFSSASSDPDGLVTSYAWTFGDGGTSADPSPDHPFSGEGTYQVTLAVTDDWGNTSSVTKVIEILLPDLQVATSGISIAPGSAGVGQNLTMSVRVDNNGSASIHGAIIAFLIDGEPIGTAVVDIPSHSTSTAVTFWTAVEGEHELVIDIDGGGMISEISEENNRVAIQFTVDGDQVDSPLDSSTGAVIVLIGVVAVAVCVVMLSRKKGRTGKR
ncbi:MAG: PKD domain-containing protein [Methanomassiliicoccales archaeon]|nr:PKD domain-containing protein [Methanomassiliicoccales archaeon]